MCRRVEGLPAGASSSSDHEAAVRVCSGLDGEEAAADGKRRLRERAVRHGPRCQPAGDSAGRREGTGMFWKKLEASVVRVLTRVFVLSGDPAEAPGSPEARGVPSRGQ